MFSFPQWDRVLDVLQEALDHNGVKNLRLKSGAAYEQTLNKFKVCYLHIPHNFVSMHCTYSTYTFTY